MRESASPYRSSAVPPYRRGPRSQDKIGKENEIEVFLEHLPDDVFAEIIAHVKQNQDETALECVRRQLGGLEGRSEQAGSRHKTSFTPPDVVDYIRRYSIGNYKPN